MTESTKLRIDTDDLTIDEMEELEVGLGGSLDSAFADGQPKAKALRWLVFIVKRREDPAATLESVGSLRLADVDLVGLDDEDDAPGE